MSSLSGDILRQLTHHACKERCDVLVRERNKVGGSGGSYIGISGEEGNNRSTRAESETESSTGLDHIFERYLIWHMSVVYRVK